jgi:hypothetical protein
MKLILACTLLAAIGYAQYPPPCPPLCPKGGNGREAKTKTVKQQKPKPAQVQQSK